MSVNRLPVLAPRILGPLAAVSLLVLGVGLTLFSPCHQRKHVAPGYRLHLKAPVEPHCYYGTAWSQGPVVTEIDPREGRTTYIRQFHFIDGCLWQATETLTPGADDVLNYEYREHVLSCRPGAVPAMTCPRNGTVALEPLSSTEGLRATPLFSSMPHQPRPRYHGCMEFRSARRQCDPNRNPHCSQVDL